MSAPNSFGGAPFIQWRTTKETVKNSWPISRSNFWARPAPSARRGRAAPVVSAPARAPTVSPGSGRGPASSSTAPTCSSTRRRRAPSADRRIDHIAAGFYSHWHPDHTAGRRMYETRNWDWRGWPPAHICTPIYLPPQVAVDFTTHLGLAENFAYLQHVGLVDVRLSDASSSWAAGRTEAHPCGGDVRLRAPVHRD
ncbi:MAG: hypothetical protein R3A10_14260 [Caldilineaceae bacterium]